MSSNPPGWDDGAVLAPASSPEHEAGVKAVWEPGDVVVGVYKVQEVAGEGGMGAVYRVRHLGWGVDLAVKSPLPRLFESEAQKRAFEREAQTWVELGLHPNVCACHYVRRLGGIPRVFAEYADAGSLHDWVVDGRLYAGGSEAALPRIMGVAIQFAHGLAHAHDRGLVHQDVKPANVLLTGDGEVKVADFGIARARQALEPATAVPVAAVDPRVSYGGRTRGYQSPEQARAAAGGDARLTAASDVWSFAVSVLELFLGDLPGPDGVAAARALDRYLERGSEPGIPAMPAAVADLLSRCLRKEPHDRPGSMAEIAAQLTAIYETETGSPHPRPEAEAARLLAGELSNRALSMLDLGRPDEPNGCGSRRSRPTPTTPTPPTTAASTSGAPGASRTTSSSAGSRRCARATRTTGSTSTCSHWCSSSAATPKRQANCSPRPPPSRPGTRSSLPLSSRPARRRACATGRWRAIGARSRGSR